MDRCRSVLLDPAGCCSPCSTATTANVGRHTQEVERFNTELQAQRDQVQHMNDLLELKILRSQLNPHFIHNCQNSAMAMVKEGRNVEALAYLQGLSKLMRMVLEHSVNDRITVEEEMAFLRLYVKLERCGCQGSSARWTPTVNCSTMRLNCPHCWCSPSWRTPVAWAGGQAMVHAS